MQTIRLTPPYLIFVDETEAPMYAKTGLGLVQWRRELCKGQLRLAENKSVDLGLPPMSLQAATDAGVGSLLIGTAAIGGSILES